MKDLISAELLKFRTTRMTYGLALGMIGSVALDVAANILNAGQHGNLPLDTKVGVASVLSAAGSGAFFMLLLGILALAGEFRHNTVTSTFLTTPDRRRVVAAKLVASGFVGLLFAGVGSVVALAIAMPWLAAKGVDFGLVRSEIGITLLGAFLVTALYGLVGVGVGALIRNAVAAIAVAVVWMMIVENLLVGLLPQVGKWLPGGAASALALDTTPGELLPRWGGGALLFAYAITFAAVGTRFVLRRDVT